MRWTPPRDATDPDRFYSGDAIRDYLCTCSITQRNELLLSIDVKQLRPYVVLACLQITDGQPKGFLERARERLTAVWGTRDRANELIEISLSTSAIARRAWMLRLQANGRVG